MTNNQLPTKYTTPSRWAKWGKVTTIVCAAIVVVVIIGLVAIQQPIVIVKFITSLNQLNTFKTALISLGTAAFGLMLMAVAIADTTTDKRARRFVLGFLGWPMLNVIAGAVAFGIGYALTANCRAQSSCGIGEGFGLLLIIVVTGLITNIGIFIFLAVTRRWWIVTGMVTALIATLTGYVNRFGWPL